MKLQWGRIIVGALLLEMVLIAVFVPLVSFFGVSKVAPFATVGVFVIGFAISWWLVSKVRARPVLHGTIIGVLATALYLLMCAVQPGGIAPIAAAYGPVFFLFGNILRILGCSAGGFACSLRTRMT